MFRPAFNVLAIESSADDTCAAIVSSTKNIFSNIVIKQNSVHETYGGINPKHAIDSHQRNLPYAVGRALDESGFDIINDIHGIAFTRGPGMPGCLSVGMNAAKTLAASLNKPLVGVHHMQGHALTPLLTCPQNPPTFPFLSLLVSGGHTMLLLAKSLESFKVLATTQDESVGRTFDKVSRLLDLKWTSRGPGHALEAFCEEVIPGLHSQVQRLWAQHGGPTADLLTKQAIARAFQSSVVDQLEEKVLLGLQWCKDRDIAINHLILSGGVASNDYIRRRLTECLASTTHSHSRVALICPPQNLCTDNAVMIGWASMHRFLASDSDPYSIGLQPKWSIEDL